MGGLAEEGGSAAFQAPSNSVREDEHAAHGFIRPQLGRLVLYEQGIRLAETLSDVYCPSAYGIKAFSSEHPAKAGVPVRVAGIWRIPGKASGGVSAAPRMRQEQGVREGELVEGTQGVSVEKGARVRAPLSTNA